MEVSNSFFWFRRDLRLNDNHALFQALKSGKPVICVFIFDTDILNKLEDKDDARVTFIYKQLEKINIELVKFGSSLLVKHGNPLEIWKGLMQEYSIANVFCNRDYEPYALNRDKEVRELLKQNKIAFHDFKDQVVFEPKEILKSDGKPYTVYTPYMKKWHSTLQEENLKSFPSELHLSALSKQNFAFPTLADIGFEQSNIEVPNYTLEDSILINYKENRDFPAIDKTSYLSTYLRFGVVSIREITKIALQKNQTFANELIWREFFMQILVHFPKVVSNNFSAKYDFIEWRNNEKEFELWCQGKTGYPIVDAGMRQLNETGLMHNRVRMVVASFLCKHLLIDWRWGEAYFAAKLLDYELSSNNGNWQWAAGTGCDAAPYFRVFNPYLQTERFDPKNEYIKRWVKDINELTYPTPIVEHKLARERALEVYKRGIEKANF